MGTVQGFESLREFEKSIYKTKVITSEVFPLISEEDFTFMQLEWEQDKQYPLCFAYCRKNAGVPFIDIYMWDAIFPGCHRFVLREGYSLKDEDERLFFEYFNSTFFQYKEENMELLLTKVTEQIPHIHICYYSDHTHVFLHLFYTLTRSSGVQELLFKAKLNYLAVGLSKVDGYNMIASTPSSVFDGVPNPMLHALNSSFGAEALQIPEDRQIAKVAYERWPNLIHDRSLTRYQWEYLKGCVINEEEPVKKLFLFWGKINRKDEYYNYLCYRELREYLKDYYYPLPEYPSSVELFELMRKCKSISYFIEEEDRFNFHIKNAAKRYGQYNYEDTNYTVFAPSTLEEILDEASQQHNCLYDYIWEYTRKGTAILFMRRRDEPKKSLVTLEIIDGVICQAWQKCNEPLTRGQKQFLKKYAKEKELLIDFNYLEWED